MQRSFPSFSQLKQIFKVLKKTERNAFLVFSFTAIASFMYLVIILYSSFTVETPAFGGTFTEGIVGQPRFINPIYGDTNDTDRVLISLIYSGLMKYDKDGNITGDLAEEYRIEENGRKYVFELKDNIYWHDGEKLTADDVLFTIKTIQNSDYKSPLRVNWLNVEVEKISENTIAFYLGTPYSSFLENCTVKIIPQHIWEEVTPENFALSIYNLQPIGSGSYILEEMRQNSAGFIELAKLTSNPRYYEKPPFIKNFNVAFFETKEKLTAAANKKDIDGFSNAFLEDPSKLKKRWLDTENFILNYQKMPTYFAVFFNTQNPKIFSDFSLNKALLHTIDKEQIVKKITKPIEEDHIYIVDSPILPEYFNFNKPEIKYEFNLEKAQQMLTEAGYKKNDGGGWTKNDEKQPAFQFNSYLKKGSSGSVVVELQSCLLRLDPLFNQILEGKATGNYGNDTDEAITEFQKKYLPNENATGETGPATRTKLNELCFNNEDGNTELSFTLMTVNQPQLVAVAKALEEAWGKIGVKVYVHATELSDLRDAIKDRDYDAILYGQALSMIPDLYPFWHSTQINDPGLNLSRYENENVDQILKEIREENNNEVKKEKYEVIQDMILQDAPALFLYNVDYLYWVSDKIKGIETTRIVDPAKRFVNVENWYIKTKRALK